MKVAVGRCWEEPGRFHSKQYAGQGGYAKVGYEGKSTYGHRVAYKVLVGPIPEGMMIDHVCRNRACYNPAHLEIVTPQENTRRSLQYRGGCCRVHGYLLNETTGFKAKDLTCVGGFLWRCLECNRVRMKERYWTKRKTVV